MKILVVNAGSSSLKYQLIDMEGEKVIAKGLVERIGMPQPGHQKQTVAGKVYEVSGVMIEDHVQACTMMLKALQDPEKGAIRSMVEIGAVGHRVLHGGTKFSASVVVDEKVKDAIRECIPLGPLHNPANLMGIEACEKVMPDTPQVAVFDTAFHQTMPPKAYMYGVPKKYFTQYGVRKYGFHGTSHRYVSKRVCEFLGISPLGQKIIICHLGNGSSLSAVVDGKCVDLPPGQRLQPLRRRRRQVRGHLHGPDASGRSADGHPLRHPGPGRGAVHRKQRKHDRGRSPEHDEQAVGPPGHRRQVQRHA